MKPALTTMLCVLFSGALMAADYGDAPASYGLVGCDAGGPFLGSGVSNDATSPVTPAWTGDNDDGVVGNPVWTPGSSGNSLSVSVNVLGGQALLTLWVDANDDGTWSPSERYDHPQTPITVDGTYTFHNIYLSTMNFLRCGRDKVAIRLIVRDEFGYGGQIGGPTGFIWLAEVEDWRIPVTPLGFAVAGDNPLPPALENNAYSNLFSTINGTAPYTWSMIAGSLPPGLSLTQAGNNYLLAGTPAAGSAGPGGTDYAFTLQCTCPTGTTQRALSLRVRPTHALPFKDDFSNDRGWTLGPTWQRGPAVAYVSTAGYPTLNGTRANEPGVDFTPGNSDNMILGDCIGADYANLIQTPYSATSPCIDCTGASSVELRFMRYIGVGDGGTATGHDGAAVLVSHDGTNWTTLWLNPAYPPVYVMNGATADSGWTLQVFDISAVAANRRNVQVRFRIGTTDAANRYTGWCVDDVEVRATPDRSKLAATNLTIHTPYSSGGLPLCYRNSSYPAAVTLANTGTEAILVNSILFGVQEVQQSPWDQISWHHTGVFNLAVPTLIGAGASGVVLSGTYDCAGATSGGSGLELQATLILSGPGQTSASLHEAQATFQFRIMNVDAPGLYLYEEVNNGVPILNGAAATGRRDFGSVIAGQSSAWLRIAVRNSSSSALTLSNPASSASEFIVDTTYYNTTPAGSSTTVFDIRFAPTTPGVKQATITITHNALNTTDPFVFDLRGTGVVNAPVLQVFETSAAGTPIANGAPAAGGRNFGTHDINSGPGNALVIHIENAGTVALTLGIPQLVPGTGPGDFVLDTLGMSTTVAAGASTQFSVAFDPTALGLHTAAIRFTHNDSGITGPFEFFIEGQGILPVPVLSVFEQSAQGPQIPADAAASGGRAFGAFDVANGATAAVTIVITNTGWVDLQLTTPGMMGANAGDFVLGLAGFSTVVAPGAFTAFTVAFDPVAKGPKAAIVEFSHNDNATANPYRFHVTGTGLDPAGVGVLTVSLPHGQDKMDYSPFALGAGGGTAPYAWTIISGATPAGLVLAANGELSGTLGGGPAQYTFVVRVTDATGGTDDKSLNLIVTPAPGDIGQSNGSGGGCSASGNGAMSLIMLALMLAACTIRGISKRGA
ncbi:MAG: choice-of-anchor D domain-containing protein [Planctomycetes bacterium]|nr:choice-of-anchor D domain-containing protein [Planctomycetota bacterium]